MSALHLFDEPVKPMAVTIRPYQETALQRIEGDMDRGPNRGLLVLPTGTGKTTVFTELIRRRQCRTLIVAHQVELLEQGRDRIRQMIPGVNVSIESGDAHADRHSDVILAGVQSIGRIGNQRLSWFKPDLIIVDEAHHSCFAPGTLVDGKPIESLSPGDYVESFNHETKKREAKRIRNIWRNKVKRLWRVTFENNESILVTPDHNMWMQVYNEKPEYRPMSSLGVESWCFARNHAENDTQNVRHLRRDIHSEKLEQQDDTLLRGSLQEGGKGREGQTCECELLSVPNTCDLPWSERFDKPGRYSPGTCLLLDPVSGQVCETERFKNGHPDQQTVRLTTDEGRQPNEVGSIKAENGANTQGDRPQAETAGREWSPDSPSANIVLCAARSPLEAGASDSDQGGDDRRGNSSELPKARYCEYGVYDRHRSRWEFSQCAEGEASRPHQGTNLGPIRVACVEVLEPGSDGTFGGLCPNGVVYDIEVEDNHNYFVGESGILVHNCADSYVATFQNFGVFDDGAPYLLGVTATPHRMDNKPLHGSDVAIYQKVLYQYTLREAIADGYLCDVRGYRVAATGLDLSGIKKTAGDYNQGQLQEAMDHDEVTECGIDAWAQVASDRQTIVFCTGVEHAENVAKAFQQRGYSAADINGKHDRESRTRIMRAFKQGELQVLTNMQLVTEGVDVPNVGCVLMLRPTQSWALYTQMVGRGLRINEGKSDCIVIDVVGNTASHQLGKNPPVSVAGVFDLPLGLDLGGELITTAIEAFEELEEYQQADLFKRVIDMRGLQAALTEVDLLAELAQPEEIRNYSGWAWQKLNEGHYILSCGSTKTEEKCRVEIKQDAIGNYAIYVSSSTRAKVIDCDDSIKDTLLKAELEAEAIWPNVGYVVSVNAKWRREPPTEKQIELLTKLNVDPLVIQKMNKGQASSQITKLFMKKGNRK